MNSELNLQSLTQSMLIRLAHGVRSTIGLRDCKTATSSPTVVPLLTSRMPVVDGLRGLAIIAVLVFHFAHFGVTFGTSAWERYYQNVAGMGWVGVDLFFVLSGFLITGILIDARNSSNYFVVFYFRRAIRIFPLYYLSLALLMTLAPFSSRVVQHQSQMVQPIAKLLAWLYLLNIQIAIGSFSAIPVYLQHLWSLAIEEQFYALWPLIVRRLDKKLLVVVCVGMAIVSLVLRVIFRWLGLDAAAYVFTFCRLDALAIGALVAVAVRQANNWKTAIRIAPLVMASTLGALIVLAVVVGVSYENFWMGTVGISLWAIMFGSSLVLLLAANHSGLAYRLGSSRILRTFGKYSYCLYICHQPVILILSRLGIRSDRLVLIFKNQALAILAENGIAFSAVIVIAYLSWHLFEKPILRLKALPGMQYKNGPGELPTSAAARLTLT